MAEMVGNLDGIPEPVRSMLAPLRTLVLEVAASNAAIGPLRESIKWGEPSYAPTKKHVGSSVRLAPRKDGKLSMNFICHTGLVARFRELYGDRLDFEGNRTIVVNPNQPLPRAELSHCIAMALTYFIKSSGMKRP